MVVCCNGCTGNSWRFFPASSTNCCIRPTYAELRNQLMTEVDTFYMNNWIHQMCLTGNQHVLWHILNFVLGIWCSYTCCFVLGNFTGIIYIVLNFSFQVPLQSNQGYVVGYIPLLIIWFFRLLTCGSHGLVSSVCCSIILCGIHMLFFLVKVEIHCISVVCSLKTYWAGDLECTSGTQHPYFTLSDDTSSIMWRFSLLLIFPFSLFAWWLT